MDFGQTIWFLPFLSAWKFDQYPPLQTSCSVNNFHIHFDCSKKITININHYNQTGCFVNHDIVIK
jgi:hypothetical protein